MTYQAPELDIDQRQGWPDELLVLLKDYPRETWRSNSSPVARFWLDKHDYFRNQCRVLEAAGDEYRREQVMPRELGARVVPRLQGFLGALHGHHQVEDFHYFPAFRAAENRLSAGFDVLAADHELLHKGIMEIVEAANAFINTIRDDSPTGRDAQRHAGDRFVEVGETVYRRLMRHLDDEEDLIIPLMLHQGH